MRPALSVFLLVVTFALPAARGEVFRYGRFEQTLESADEIADPLAVEVLVEFATAGAREHVAAFWDGGRTWKVRFSPERTGSWSWRVLAAGFQPPSGAFRAVEYTGANELYRRGAPRLSGDRRYFVHADGKPWFWLACTAWNGALLATDQEWERYLADRAAKKFTAVQFVTTQWRAGRADELGQVAFSGREHIRVHPEFFQRLDRRVDALNDRGLVAAPVVLWALTSKDQESPGEALPVDQAVRLARYITARYGAHAVLWLLGGDGDYRGEKADRWRTIGRAVFPAGRPRRPVTLHPRGMHEPWLALKDEPWLDFFMYQSGHGSDEKKWRWNATRGPAADWKLEPPRPVIDGEPNYEGHVSYHSRRVISDYDVRRAAYYSLLAAPPAGVSYGAHGIWSWARKREVPLDHPRSGEADPWHVCLDYPGARHMRVLREVFESFEWWRLRPDRSLLAEDLEGEGFSAYMMPARSTDGRFGIVYLPANPSIRLNLAAFGGRVQAEWIDPRSGERRPAGRLKGGVVDLQTPGAGDWLLHLRR